MGACAFDVLDATFVKIETDEGITGWGEGTPWGHTYVPAHGPGIRAGIETLAPALMGLDPRELEMIEYAMDKQLPGHLYAKSAIDLACWDIKGQASNMSLTQMLGGDRGGGVRIMSSVSSGTPDYMLNIIKDYRAMAMLAILSKSAEMLKKTLSVSAILKPTACQESAFYMM